MAQRVTRALLEEDAQCAQTALYWSLQCRIDYYMAVHLPSETREMAKMVDAGLRECYAEVLGKDLLSPEGVTLRDGTPVTVDNGFQRDRALLKTRHEARPPSCTSRLASFAADAASRAARFAWLPAPACAARAAASFASLSSASILARASSSVT